MRGSMAIVLVSLGAILVVGTLMTFRQIHEHDQYGRTINLAGRQRMLLETMMLEASAVAHGDDAQRPALAQTEAEFDTSLTHLQQGDGGLGVVAPPAEIRAALDGIAELWLVFRAQATLVTAAPADGMASETPLGLLTMSHRTLLADIDRTVSLYERALSAKVATTEKILVALAVLGALVGAAAWWFMLGRVVRPLSQLAAGAVRFGSGDLHHRVPVEGLNEVGVAAREFNAMAERLEVALSAERDRARYDAATGTLNHVALTDVLRALLAEQPVSLAVCMADVDGMKAVNDTYGHQVGDTVLLAVVRALSRDGAIVGRYGGDEFVALLPGVDGARAERYCAEVEDCLARSGLRESRTGASVPVAASLGTAVYPAEAETADTLLRLADAAMYVAKRQHQVGALGMSISRSDDRTAATIGELLPLLASPGKLEDKLRLVSHRLSVGAGYDVVMFETYTAPGAQPSATNTFARAPDELIDRWNQEQRTRTRRPLEDGFMKTRRAVVLDDPQNDERLTQEQRAVIRAADLRSAASVPMFWQDELVGSLNVACKRANAFTPGDIQFLTSVAGQVTALMRMVTLVDDLAATSSRLADSQADAIILLAAAAEAHDQGTGEHLQRVRVVATRLARELGDSEQDADALGMAAVLHDIGKIRVPDAILASPAQLSDVEWALMKQHTVWGADFLSERPGFELAVSVARAHHERWDGTGYPAGLVGDEIPLAAAIVSVADAFDAMTHDRPYRAGRSIQWAVSEIQAAAGTQFSPRVVAALARLHEGRELPLTQSEDLDLAA